MPGTHPEKGDVVVSNTRATPSYDIYVSPNAEPEATLNHDGALELGHQLARQRKVDLWLTEDQRHFIPVASYR